MSAMNQDLDFSPVSRDSFMKLFQINSIFTKKFLVKKEYWYLVSKLVIIFFSPLLLNVNKFELHISQMWSQLVQSLVTELTVLLGEKCQERPRP